MKKGFTLVELIGVMVILSILMLVVFPNVINTIKTTNDKVDSYTQDLIFNAVRIKMNNSPKIYTKNSDNSYCFLISELKDEENLSSSIDLSKNDLEEKAVKVKYESGKFTYEIVNDCVTQLNEYCFISTIAGEINYYDETCGNNLSIPYNLKLKTSTCELSLNMDKCITTLTSNSIFENAVSSCNGLISNPQEAFIFLYNYDCQNMSSDYNSIVKISNYAFANKSLESVKIPSSITAIGDNAFMNNKLTSVTIGKCSPAQLTVNDFTTIFGWANGFSDTNINWAGTNCS